MTDFEFLGKMSIILVFHINFSHFFHFHVLLYFVGIMYMICKRDHYLLSKSFRSVTLLVGTAMNEKT